MKLDFYTTGIEYEITKEGYHRRTKKGYVFVFKEDSKTIDIMSVIMKEIIDRVNGKNFDEGYIVVTNKKLSDEELLRKVSNPDKSVIPLF